MSDDTRSLEVLFLQEKLAGTFEIISEIHRRGNSTMFLAQDLILDRNVALKTLKFNTDSHPELINRWNQNLKRCLRLDEPHVARIYSYGSTGPLYYIILEYIESDVLEDLIAAAPDGLPIWKCLRIGRDIAQGLHAAHNLGITHHRLTPSNIAVSPDGFSRVLDLGAAQGTIDALAQRPWSATMDCSLYFAPEQIESAISEPQSDQYRLAAILYHALTGKPAFADTGEIGAFERLHEDPMPLSKRHPDIPEELNAIVLKAMCRHPDERFSDCNAFALQLESLEPDLWLPDIDPVFRSATPEATVALLLSEAHRNEKNRQYYRALVLCDQALTLAPYNTEVTTTMLRVQKLHEKEQNLRSLVNKALVAYYSNSLNEALTILQTGRQLDKDHPEILRLTHEVMQEQERKRLINVLLDAAKIDLAKQAFSAAMSNVVRVLDIDARNETALKLKQRIEFAMEDRATLGALLNRSVAAFERDHFDEAEDLLSKVFQIDPDNFSAKNLKEKIAHQKKRHLIMELWENLDREFRVGQYRKAIEILKRIAQIEPSLKHDIRDRLVRIREKLAEQNDVIDTGETRPIRAVRSEDLQSEKAVFSDSAETDSPDDNEADPDHHRQSFDETPHLFEALPQESALQANQNVIEPNDLTEEPVLAVPKPATSIPRNPIILMLIIVISIVTLAMAIWSRFGASDSDTDLATEPTVVILVPTATPLSVDMSVNTETPLNDTPHVSDTPSDSEHVQSLLASARANETRENFEMAAALYREVIAKNRGNREALDGIRRCNAAIAAKARKEQEEKARKTNRTAVPKRRIAATPTATPTVRPTQKPKISPRPSPAAPARITPTVSCMPRVPVKGKPLKINIRFDNSPGHNVTQVWLNYKKRSESYGYRQLVAKRTKTGFEVTIPESEVMGTAILYYLNGFDQAGQEFFYGSSNEPKLIP